MRAVVQAVAAAPTLNTRGSTSCGLPRSTSKREPRARKLHMHSGGQTLEMDAFRVACHAALSRGSTVRHYNHAACC